MSTITINLTESGTVPSPVTVKNGDTVILNNQSDVDFDAFTFLGGVPPFEGVSIPPTVASGTSVTRTISGQNGGMFELSYAVGTGVNEGGVIIIDDAI